MSEIVYFRLNLMRNFLLFLAFSGCYFKSSGQLTSADSSFFQSIFTNPRYVEDSFFVGSWYHYPSMDSVAQLYSTLNNSFVFGINDLDSISTLQVANSFEFDTMVNNSMIPYPWMYGESNKMVTLDYSFLNKSCKAYSYYYPDTLTTDCNYAFLVVPGTGANEAYQIVNGWGYHNQLCLMLPNLRKYGDVFTFIKPNEESRAIFWNKLKLNEYIVTYLISQSKRYGINYLIELIAWVRFLKNKYDKVFLFGLSEGGYSSLLCTMFEEPTAAMISGGYSIGFDTSAQEKSILMTRFDSLLDTFSMAKVKDKIQNSSTHYLFTWGENDPVVTMDPEHDFHYTENYFNGLSNCSYFYDFNDHTFPPCPNIDTFIERMLKFPVAHFRVIDTLQPDTLRCQVEFCEPGNYSFDLFRDNQFVQTFTQVIDKQEILLTDSGMYSIRNVMDTSYSGICKDSIRFETQFAVNTSQSIKNNVIPVYRNPFHDELHIQLPANSLKNVQLNIMDAAGKVVLHIKSDIDRIVYNTSTWPSGIYIVKIISDAGIWKAKLLKY